LRLKCSGYLFGLFSALIWFTIGCASMGPPGGGPEDKDRPFVVSSLPDTGAVMVDVESDIIISFSEPVLSSTFSEALFISPSSFKYKKIRWRKNQAHIIFDGAIPENQTIIVTVGSILQDLHRNNMQESFTLAISTGETLASGQISGRIKGERNTNGMIVGAWSTDIDTVINPIESMAPFATQVGEDNTFTLNYLSAGRYRVIAWSDRDRNRLYNPSADIIGLPSKDIILKDMDNLSLDFYALELDTGRAAPLIVSATDQTHISVRYDRMPKIELFRLDRYFHINDSVDALHITHGWISPKDSTRLILRTQPQTSGTNYTFTFIQDSIDFSFAGEGRPDTTRPLIVAFNPKDGERNVSAKLSGWIAFQDAINTTGKLDLLSLTIDDTVGVPIEFQVNLPNRLIWKAVDQLPEGSKCALSLSYADVMDLSGNSGLDTIWTVNFTIMESVTLGEISGEVVGGEGGIIRIIAEPLIGRGDSYQVEADTKGKFILENLPPGSYTLWAFEDNNLNSIYDPGSLIPFRFSEKLAVSKDTLVVRARWETAGSHIYFP